MDKIYDFPTYKYTDTPSYSEAEVLKTYLAFLIALDFPVLIVPKMNRKQNQVMKASWYYYGILSVIFD